MTQSIESLIRLIGLAGAVFGSWWVWQDASRLRKNGVNITPGLWTALVFLACLFSLPVYLVLRQTYWRKQVRPVGEVAKEFE